MENKYGGPAFPVGPDHDYNGMTLRDWFAGQALIGLLIDQDSGPDGPGRYKEDSQAARHAYAMADEMLEARSK